MLGHFAMRFVFDPVDFSFLFRAANDSPKIDDRASENVDIIPWRFEPRFRQ